MEHSTASLTPEGWLLALFSAKAAREGGTARRKKRDIERIFGHDAFMAEIARRGYSVVENAGQYVIFCNREPIRVL